jgi:hypothetical protein
VLTHRTTDWSRRRLTSGKMKNKMCHYLKKAAKDAEQKKYKKNAEP